MDKDRLKKMYGKVLESHYNGSLIMTDFVALPTQTFDDVSGKWIPYSFSMFIELKQNELSEENYRGVSTFLESVFGFECVVDIL